MVSFHDFDNVKPDFIISQFIGTQDLLNGLMKLRITHLVWTGPSDNSTRFAMGVIKQDGFLWMESSGRFNPGSILNP